MDTLTREQERMRWRSRRGLLEMDLILDRFLHKHLAQLSEDEIRAYDALLQLPDNDLLDLAMGRKEPADAAAAPVLEKIRRS